LRNGRIREVAHLVKIARDKPAARLNHNASIQYSEWWRGRVVDDEVAAKTANIA